MLLNTPLHHLETDEEITQALNQNENVVICCGRMGPMCLPVYDVMSELERSGEYDHVAMRDLAFDTPDAVRIRRLPEVRTFRGLPFTLYFKNGEVVHATASIQTREEIETIIKKVF